MDSEGTKKVFQSHFTVKISTNFITQTGFI